MKEQKAKDLLSFDEAEGKVSAVFSVFNEIDSDGDVVLPKSIRSGYGDKGVVMCWGHDWKHIIGKGVIRNEDNQAVFHGDFNMNTTAGKEAYETVKAMGDIQQWSFGFEVNDSERGMFTKDGQETEVRFLKDVKVWEVSPEDIVDDVDTEFEEVEEVKDVGLRFTDEVDNLLIKMTALLKRAKELTALRLGKEKTLSEDSTEALTSLKDALEEMHQDIDTLLTVGSADDVEVIQDEIDVNDLFRTTTDLLADTLDL